MSIAALAPVTAGPSGNPLADRRARLAEFRGFLGRLASAVDRAHADEGLKFALETVGRFWQYSPFNALLIWLQRDDATRVAGRRLWESLGRRVKPGERPILIFAPSNGQGTRFLVVRVYDVRQTRGRRLPEVQVMLRGKTPEVARLELAVRALGVGLTALPRDGGCLGVSLGGEIGVRKGLPGQERAAVIAHELAHELLHHATRRQIGHALREAEAEACAHMVLCQLGLPSHAPRYIAWHGGTGAMIQASFGRIQRAARRILSAAGCDPLRALAGPGRAS